MGARGKRKIFLKNIDEITGSIANIMQIVSGAVALCAFLFKKPLIAWILIVISAVVFCGCIVCWIIIMLVERSNNKMMAERQKCEESQKEESRKEKYRDEYIRKNLLINRRKKRIYCMMLCCIFIGMVSGYQIFKPMEVEGSEPGRTSENEGQDSEMNTVKKDGTDGEDGTGISYDKVANVSFILNENIPRLENPSDIEKIFYISYKNGECSVENHIKEIKNTQKANGTGKQSGLESWLVNQASAKETSFEEKVEEAKAYKEKRQMEKWQETVPSVSDYQKDVVAVRCAIIDDEKADGVICFLAANDYQYIGNEYKAQNKDCRALIYYWGQSIIYTEEAMSYADISEEEWKERYRYLKMRYRDIADNIEKNLDKFEEGEREMYKQWGDAARDIYEAM